LHWGPIDYEDEQEQVDYDGPLRSGEELERGDTNFTNCHERGDQRCAELRIESGAASAGRRIDYDDEDGDGELE
jgi:hypothetical protein